jgi:hypothetical protein
VEKTPDKPQRPEATEKPVEPRAPEAPRTEKSERPTRVVTVQYRSRPNGATVRTKAGGRVGTTPFALSLRPGTVQHLTFSKSGYSTASKRVVVGDANHAVTVELARPRRSGRR